MSDSREAFLAGDRPDDVALFLSESYVSDDRLERFGERVDGGVLLIVDGDRGRNAFQAATGVDAMSFAGSAMNVEGLIDGDLAGGTCPEEAGERGAETEDDDAGADGDEGGDHAVEFVFAFAEERNEEVGGIYAEGDVIHAYAKCACGTAYSDRWNVAEPDEATLEE